MSVHLRPTQLNRAALMGLIGLVALLALLIAPGTSFAPRVLAQDKSLVWERFDTDIEIHRDGSFTVTERQTIRVTRGSFSVGFRDIPFQRLAFINEWEVSDDRGNV